MKAYLSLGSNMGCRECALQRAVDSLHLLFGEQIDYSRVYESEPWGFDSKEYFLNMVVGGETTLTPNQLLSRVLEIEQEIGRKRVNSREPRERYQSRIIDIDIILYSDSIVENERLQVPHPRMDKRKFVLAPLNELVPNYIHPILNKSVSELLEECNDPTWLTLLSSITIAPQRPLDHSLKRR